MAFSLSDHSVNIVSRVWSWEADRHGSAQLMLLGYGSREMISPLYLLLLVFSRFFREATTALLIRSVLLLKVAVLKNACADTQFANQVEDIHI